MSWNTSVGTAGAAQSLTRKVTLADPYSAMIWRVQYTDENGDSREIGDEIDFASVQEIEKYINVEPAAFTPADSSTDWVLTPPGAYVYLHNGDTGSATNTYWAGVPAVNGTTITQVTCQFDEAAGATAELKLYKKSTVLATVSATGSGQDSASLSETVTVSSQFYSFRLQLNGNGSATGAGIANVRVQYTAPSYVQTY